MTVALGPWRRPAEETCACGCGRDLDLAFAANGHAIGCRCRPCLGRRVRHLRLLNEAP